MLQWGYVQEHKQGLVAGGCPLPSGLCHWRKRLFLCSCLSYFTVAMVIPNPKHITEERVYFGLEFQRSRVHAREDVEWGQDQEAGWPHFHPHTANTRRLAFVVWPHLIFTFPPSLSLLSFAFLPRTSLRPLKLDTLDSEYSNTCCIKCDRQLGCDWKSRTHETCHSWDPWIEPSI